MCDQGLTYNNFFAADAEVGIQCVLACKYFVQILNVTRHTGIRQHILRATSAAGWQVGDFFKFSSDCTGGDGTAEKE